MTRNQYKNIIKWTLRNKPEYASEDTYSTTKEILSNCGVPFPSEGQENAVEVLRSGEYMGWSECSAEQARQAANEGIAAVGINTEQILVIEPDDDEVSNVENSEFSRTMDTLYESELADMQFFSQAIFGVDDDGAPTIMLAGTTTTHTHSYTIAATCTSPKKCSCGATSGSSLGHSYGSATCTSAAKCSRCSATTGSALGHSYGSATCTSAAKCSRCSATTGSALGHSYGSATCTSAAKCSRCSATTGSALGHSYGSATCTSAAKCSRCSATTGSALGHSYSSATCTSAAKCSRCGGTSGSSLGHSYGSATCTSAAKCSRCSATTGSALGHSYTIAATCTSAAKCSRCSATTGSALGHSYGSATCTSAPKCSRCNSTSGSALGHNYSTATCTSAPKCSRCNGTSGSALGHSYTIAATCTSAPKCSRCSATSGSALTHIKGAAATCYNAQVCTRGCGYVYVPALGHDCQAATCLAPSKCSRCGGTTGTALGHDCGEWVIVTVATCTATGKKKTSCKRSGCSAFEEQTIPKLEHAYTPATCTSPKICSMCNIPSGSTLTHIWINNGAISATHPHPQPQKCSRSGCTATQSIGTNSLSSCTTCNPPQHVHDTSNQALYCDTTHTTSVGGHKTYKFCNICNEPVYDNGVHTKGNCTICHSSHTLANDGNPSATHTANKGHEQKRKCIRTFSCPDRASCMFAPPDSVYVSLDSCTTCNPVVKYTISYNLTDGSGSFPSQQKDHGDNEFRIYSTIPVRTGYTFLGWSTSSNGTVVYQSNAKYTGNANLTLYAIWEIKKYTISYNTGCTMVFPNQQKDHGDNEFRIYSTIPVKTDYTFLGWSTSSGGTVVYQSNAKYTGNANLTLYAIWSDLSLSIAEVINMSKSSNIEDVLEAQDYLAYLYVNNKNTCKSYIQAYVNDQGGMKTNIRQNDIYQIIYSCPPNYTRNGLNPDTEGNMYDNYTYTVFDALTWLIQTEGKINFVLQTRITEIPNEAYIEMVKVIRAFGCAYNYMNNANYNITSPKFYIGSTGNSSGTITSIYQSVISSLTTNEKAMIGGVYFGSENPPYSDDSYQDIVNAFTNNVLPILNSNNPHSGLKAVWIPFIHPENVHPLADQFEYLNLFKTNSPSNKIVVAIQPGTFYYNVSESEANQRMNKIYDSRGQNTGFELEFDMGLLTGRRDGVDDKTGKYTLTAFKKAELLKQYFSELNNTYFDNNYPIAIYSGGPNEHGYRNISQNLNLHNNGNHIPYHLGSINNKWQHKEPYNSTIFQKHYSGNLIYDINSYIFNGDWNYALTELFEFGYTPPEADKSIQVGSTVKVLESARYYAGTFTEIPSQYKNIPYIVDGIRTDGSQIRLQPINSWVWITDVHKQ